MALPEQPVSQQHDAFGLPLYVMERLGAAFPGHDAIESVTLYGSRAKGTYRHNSDIDLMLNAPHMNWTEFNQLEREIDDLLLPWKVDMALRHQVENSDLLDHVDRVGVAVFDR